MILVFAMSSGWFVALLLLVSMVGAAAASVALRASRPPILAAASVVASIEQGTAELLHGENGQAEPVGAAAVFIPEDRIRTAADGVALVTVLPSALLVFDHDTEAALQRFEQDALRLGKVQIAITLSRGRAALYSGTTNTPERAAITFDHAVRDEHLARDDEFIERSREIFSVAYRSRQTALHNSWTAIAGPFLPGSLVFPIQRTGETLRIALTTDSRERLLLRRAFLYRRLAEWLVLREMQSPRALRANDLVRRSIASLAAAVPPEDPTWREFVVAWDDEVAYWGSLFAGGLAESKVELFSALPPPPPPRAVATSTPTSDTPLDASPVPHSRSLIPPTPDLTPTGTVVQ